MSHNKGHKRHKIGGVGHQGPDHHRLIRTTCVSVYIILEYTLKHFVMPTSIHSFTKISILFLLFALYSYYEKSESLYIS